MPSVTPPSRPGGPPPESAAPLRSPSRRLARRLAGPATRRLHPPRSPRARATLCYAFPFVPAAVALIGERRDSHYVRAHAARALLFFALVALAQVALLLWLVVLGNLAPDGWPPVVFGILFYLAVPAVGIAALLTWLRLLSDSLAGRPVRAVGLGRAALWLERRVWDMLAALPAAEKNDPP